MKIILIIILVFFTIKGYSQDNKSYKQTPDTLYLPIDTKIKFIKIGDHVFHVKVEATLSKVDTGLLLILGGASTSTAEGVIWKRD